LSDAAARAALDAAGQLPDDELDLAATALQFARIDRPDLDWPAAEAFVSQLVVEAIAAIGAEAPGRAAAIRGISGVLHRQHGFAGDRESYDHPDNANLLAVLKRRRGLPVALGLLWLHLGEAAGAGCHGLDLPGHFLMAFGQPGDRLVCDPFDGGRIVAMERPGSAAMPGLADASAMTKRAVLLRLQNNLKVRRLQAGDDPQALACVTDMLRLAPDAGPLWLEAALLQERLGAAASALLSLDRLQALPAIGGPLAATARALRRRLTGRGASPLRGSGNRPS
jgi:regulator of sirC expression with transglutaminase-like and TPR domain